MPAYHIERWITIDAPEAKVRPAIGDFAEWPKWSPWLCMEPEAKLTYQGTPGQLGHGYSWQGEITGEGSMEITANTGSTMCMDLRFLKPWKSEAKVVMEIEPVGESQTKVTWHMDGKMPFFLFFMIGMMKAMIGMDYERGLRMLKEYVETGTVNSKTEFAGIVEVPSCQYLGVEGECSTDQIGKSMGETMPKAHQLATENDLELSGPPGALYHVFDMKGGRCKYTNIMPVVSSKPISGAVTGEIEPCKAIKVIHRGSYDHLGNAWSTAHSHLRYKKLKAHKTQCAFEFYPNDPEETPVEEILTEIYVPIRG
ncbi:MAG: SRPBCC family protein [Planctomycetota bacterium]